MAATNAFETDYTATAYVPVYVMLPLNVVDAKSNKLTDPVWLRQSFKALKSVGVDGVMADCWWGLVEATPQKYNWSAYQDLFKIAREEHLKLQLVMSFHQCGGNVGDDVFIPIPSWVREVGETNPDIYYTDQHGNRNPEYLSCGVDMERLFHGRTPVEIYFDYMKSFRQTFDEYFQDKTIVEIEVGLGPAGELRFPSYPATFGWDYPGIGEFTSYDKYLLKSLAAAAEAEGHPAWGHCPSNAGSYNSRPEETEFFKEDGGYDSWYGRFFTRWYAQTLLDHADRVLSLAKFAFSDVAKAIKVSGIHWLYQTRSHAAELTAGYNNSSNLDGYTPIVRVLGKHGIRLNFTCLELRKKLQNEGNPYALSDPEALVWQVLNAAWEHGVEAAAENALNCYDRDSYNQILKEAKPSFGGEIKHISAFTYLRLDGTLLKNNNLAEFGLFVKRLHGEAITVADETGSGEETKSTDEAKVVDEAKSSEGTKGGGDTSTEKKSSGSLVGTIVKGTVEAPVHVAEGAVGAAGAVLGGIFGRHHK